MLKYLAVAILFLFIAELVIATDDTPPFALDEIEYQDLIVLSEDGLSFLFAWLDGYLNQMNGTATLNDVAIGALGGMI